MRNCKTQQENIGRTEGRTTTIEERVTRINEDESHGVSTPTERDQNLNFEL